MTTTDAEATVRAFFDAYSDGDPDRLETLVTPDYTDYGHTPPGRGPAGVRADYDHAVRQTGGVVTYVIDAMVARDDTVAAVWTGRLPDGSTMQGLSLYVVSNGRVRETRHAAVAASA